MNRLLNAILPVFAVASLGVLASTLTVPSAEASGSANLVCCENDNGTYHPVSENGKAIDHCAQTWDIPEDENPAQYCEDGPQCPTDADGMNDYCDGRLVGTPPDFAACSQTTCDPEAFGCFLGADAEGQILCFSLVY